MDNTVKIKIKKLDPRAVIPTRAHKTDAGLDVYSVEDAVIEANGDYLFGLGWSCAVPEGFALIVKEKSGRAVKDKLHVGGCVIDSGYRGEVHVHLFNAGQKDVIIRRGEKIAQILMIPVWSGIPEVVDSLDETSRGDGGFGSTGLIENVSQ